MANVFVAANRKSYSVELHHAAASELPALAVEISLESSSGTLAKDGASSSSAAFRIRELSESSIPNNSDACCVKWCRITDTLVLIR